MALSVASCACTAAKTEQAATAKTARTKERLLTIEFSR
jgi:hypothetical protein